MKTFYFDAETYSLALPELEALMPQFEAAANLKDPEKIAANIESKRQAWIADAALSPLTGYVLVIGLMSAETVFFEGSEPTLLEAFLNRTDEILSGGGKLIGFNIFSFDLQFILKRAYRHSVKVPRSIGGWTGRYWNWNENIIDLRLLWQMGDRQAPGSLDSIARHLGVGAKTGTGKEFAKLWETEKPKAVEYIQNDLVLVREIACRMGPAGLFKRQSTTKD